MKAKRYSNIKNDYDKAEQDLTEQINLLKKKIKQHHQRFKKDEYNYGYVGDLRCIYARLVDIIDILS